MTKVLSTAVLALGITGLFSAPLSSNVQRERKISLYNIHTKETIDVVYKRGGKYQAKAMKSINWILRDWRRNEPTRMDPKLIDLVWEIHRELGSREPIHVISGYRSPKTNAMLRRKRGGQARRSQHILGKAMDIRFPDVPVHRLRYAGLIRERGGVGYYPTSGTPFVHIDTGRVRHWPRMRRHEMALLFPDGKTRHRPSTGGRLTPRDARRARKRYPGLARRVAAYHNLRRFGQQETLIATAPALVPGQRPQAAPKLPQPKLVQRPRLARASLGLPPAPKLISQPKLVDRPTRLIPGPTPADKLTLTRLAAFAAAYPSGSFDVSASGKVRSTLSDSVRTAPSLPSITLPQDHNAQRSASLSQPASFVSAPVYDSEHPEEMSYRPFPVLPFLTTTSSPHDPALARLVHPDASRTLEMLNDDSAILPMRLQPGLQTARLLWSQAFSGKAVNLDMLTAMQHEEQQNSRAAHRLSSRRVIIEN